MTSAPGPVRIGNCSGFYGDRLAAMREVLTGGALDYLTGDYLAELTMMILWKARAKDASRGYAPKCVSSRGWRSAPRDLAIGNFATAKLYASGAGNRGLFRGSV